MLGWFLVVAVRAGVVAGDQEARRGDATGFPLERVIHGAVALPAALSTRGIGNRCARSGWALLEAGAGGGSSLGAPVQEEQKNRHLWGTAFSS